MVLKKSQLYSSLWKSCDELRGGIPERDLDALADFWDAFPSLRGALFKPNRPDYADLAVDTNQVQQLILESDEFRAFSDAVRQQVGDWFDAHRASLAALDPDTRPAELITCLGDDLLDRFKGAPLLDPYDVYEQLLTYWHETMHDDVALIMMEGWTAAARPRLGQPKIYSSACPSTCSVVSGRR